MHKAESGRPEDTPLQASIEDGQVVIRIGIDVNAWAFEHSDDNNPFNDEKNDFVQGWKITDPMRFAEDTVHELRDEAEDGSSLLTGLFDRATQGAVDNGSLGMEECKDGLSAFSRDPKQES